MKRTSLFVLVAVVDVTNAYAIDGLSVTVTDAAYGARCDGQTGLRYQMIDGCTTATDDTCSINKALDAVGLPPTSGAGGGEVIIPPGTCIISPQPDSQNPGPNDYLRLYSNVTIRGSGPKSVLRVAAGQSYGRIFSNNTAGLSRVVIRDFRIDGNTACLPFNDLTRRVAIGPFGSTHGLTISGMFFDPTDSPATILVTNDHFADSPDLEATVTNNYFNFFKCSTPGAWYDVSTVLLEGSQQVIRNNTFTSVSLAQQAQSAIETLGGRSVIADNTFNNYAVPVLLVPSFYACTSFPDCSGGNVLNPSDVVIANNSATCAGAGVVIWPTTGTTLRNVSITGNSLHICNADRGVGGTAGIATNWSSDCAKDGRGYQGNIDGLTITNNVIIMQKDSRPSNDPEASKTTGGILLRPIGDLKNVLVKGNIIKDAPVSGIRIGPDTLVQLPHNPTCPDLLPHTVQRIRILDNIIVDAGNNDAADPTFRHAIGLDDYASDIEVMRNMIYDTATRPTNQLWGKYALYLKPDILSSKNVRTSQNTVQVNSSSGALLSVQGSNSLTDASSANDVLISTIQGTATSLSVNFTSFTQYITTISNSGGSLNVDSPHGPSGQQWAQWAVGQVVTFRFPCAVAQGCTVTFDPAYSAAAEGASILVIPGSHGRAITFQVENWASDTGTHKFFELYRSPAGGVPNP